MDWLKKVDDRQLKQRYDDIALKKYIDRTFKILGFCILLWNIEIVARCNTIPELCFPIAVHTIFIQILSGLVMLSIKYYPIKNRRAYWIYSLLTHCITIVFTHEDSLIAKHKIPESVIISNWAINQLMVTPFSVTVVNMIITQAIFVVFCKTTGEFSLASLSYYNAIMITCFASGLMTTYMKEKTFYSNHSAEQKLKQLQRQVSALRNLLNRLLPLRITKKILENEKHVAEFHQNCTVIFIGLNEFNEDDVNDITFHQNKKDLFAFLEWMFTLIDRKADEYGIEKIKTTSATWLGIVKSGSDQQTRATTFALAVMDMMKKERATVPVTCGISDGPVIGCVLGKLKPVYDVISDTVNTTHRLYTNGPVNGVCVTKEFSDKLSDLHDYIKVEEKGEVKLKGMGVKDLVFISTRDINQVRASPVLKRMRTNLTHEGAFERENSLEMFEREIENRSKDEIPFSMVIHDIFKELRVEVLTLYLLQFVTATLLALIDYFFVFKPRGYSPIRPLLSLILSISTLAGSLYFCIIQRKANPFVAFSMLLGVLVTIETKFDLPDDVIGYSKTSLFLNFIQQGLAPVGLPVMFQGLFIFTGYAYTLMLVSVKRGEDFFAALAIGIGLIIFGIHNLNKDMTELVKKKRINESLTEELIERTSLYEGALDSLIPKSLRSLLTDDKNFVTFHTCVMFADVVEFTEYSAKAGPGKTVRLLDEVFECIDGICVRRNMSRFKLIGDAYVACGIEGVGDNTCRNAYEASQEIMRDTQVIMERYRGIHDGLNLRIGLAEGVVSAGLIGREASRTVYDIYGGCIGEAEQCQKAAMPGEIYMNCNIL